MKRAKHLLPVLYSTVLTSVISAALMLTISNPVWAESVQTEQTELLARLDAALPVVSPQVIAWRHDIHQHPELGNRETRTSALVADALRGFGLEVQTGLAHTAVIGILRGGLPGPVVAVRAELDALPVTEPVGLPFASTVRTEYNGQQVGVMHACGHDAHVAIVLGVAKLLAQSRANLHGTVKFVFQPAEEGTPDGEEGGAALLVKQGVLENPRPDVFLGFHVGPGASGSLSLSRDRVTAGNDTFTVRVLGRQSHAAMPWYGIDPITVAAQIVLAWQTIPSRQVDLVKAPAPVITVGKIAGGVRSNILPEEVTLEGTLRTLAPEQRLDVKRRMDRTARSIAESAGASVELKWQDGYPPGANNPALVSELLPVLQEVAGVRPVAVHSGGVYASDDFAFYSRQIPAFFYGLGVTPPDVPLDQAAPNHSPRFLVDDGALNIGTRALLHLIVAYQFAHTK